VISKYQRDKLARLVADFFAGYFTEKESGRIGSFPLNGFNF
jgi:hypothetical protein